MKIKSVIHLTLASALMLSTTACTRNISSGTYAAADVGEAVTTYEGTIVAKRQVTVKEGEKFTDNQAGMLGGAVAGGILGSMIGGGRGSTLGALGGAVAGGAAGGLAQDKLSTQQAFEILLEVLLEHKVGIYIEIDFLKYLVSGNLWEIL